MKVKFNRGPKHGEYATAPNEHERIFRIVMAGGRKFHPSRATLDPVLYGEEIVKLREGEYHRSHRRLKDGTIIFEWMGWLDGKV